MLITFIGGHVGKSNNSTMLTRFLGLPHGFDLLEGNVHVMDSSPAHELKMSNPQVGPFIQGSSHDLPPSWGTLSKLKALTKHYIHQAWHILPSPSPHVHVDPKPGDIMMVMLVFITSLHRLGTFRPHIKVILGVDSSVVIFVDLAVTLMCICVGECPTFGGFLASCIGNMATN
jgi:hypothetical protein